MATPESSTTGLADSALLEKIDKLFACNVGEYISLPQLVVVGDQSSGKSSVLEGLTDLPFPRDSGLCTRFATQITFRRHATRSISVSIIPDARAEDAHADRLRKWKKEGLQLLTKETFSAIMNEVHQVMGLTGPTSGLGSGSSQSFGSQTFSKDVLKLDISGPTQEHFSVIDVPGIFSRTTSGVTTKDDKQLVRDMVMGFMQNPRSVILAVIPANVDIATQEILEMAEEVDPNSQRTLGILTKPDLVDKGAEPGVVDLVEGGRHKLHLGWHMVRNLGQSEMSAAGITRNALEASFFLRTSPWKELEKDKVGVGALKIRLREILADMVRREFPNVKKEINKKLTAAQQELKGMGLSRETRENQHKYLLEMAVRFREVSMLALRALYYGDEIFEGRPNLRLATKVVDRNILFSNDVWMRGVLVPFTKNAGKEAAKASQVIDLDCPPSPPRRPENMPRKRELPPHQPPQFTFGVASTIAGAASIRETVNAATLDPHKPGKRKAIDQLENDRNKVLVVRYTKGHPELLDILHASPDEPFPTPEEGIVEWIRKQYGRSRGFELGTFDASIVPILWKQQSAKWGEYALGYISDIISLVHDFLLELLSAVCLDNRVREGLLSVLMEPITDRYRKAVDHVKFILEVERAGTPLTQNHYFNDSLQACRRGNMRSSLQSIAIESTNHGYVIPVGLLGSSKTNMSNTDYTINDIHDILKSYYKVARKRFVDTVCMQGADHHLVMGPDTPLKVFSPSFVSELTDEQLEGIAGEDGYTLRKRKMLKKQLKDLEAGRKILY